jgi:hypothetical protein
MGREAMMWQPIETAPKDGTVVFLLYEEDGKIIPSVGQFNSEQTFRFGKLERERHEWWSSRHLFNGIGDKTAEPTHWMPVPALAEGATV